MKPSSPAPDVAIIGTGYVGLTTAACFAHLGRDVIAVDIDTAKIASLNRGRVPILEAGLTALVHDGLATRRLRFTDSYADITDAPVVMLCLPTPHDPDGGLDLRFIEQAAATLQRLLAAQAIVVTKSTVPVGTQAELAGWLARPDVDVVSNPEFLREGTAVADFLNPDRIVIGAGSRRAARTVADLYAGIDAPVHTTDPTSAELIKYAANTFLATKLSFVNEMSRLCDRLGGDITAVTAGLGSDHRIGDAFLQPGPGWGGSCFPKDTRGLAHLARSACEDLPVVEAAHASNERHLDHIVSTITRLCPEPLADARLAVWGATFKAGTDDTRDSPALGIVDRLQRGGATVTVHDPGAKPGTVPASTADDPYTACVDADMLVVLTEWADFAVVDLDKVADLLASPIIYDTRSIVDRRQAAEAGLHLHWPGRPPLVP